MLFSLFTLRIEIATNFFMKNVHMKMQTRARINNLKKEKKRNTTDY